MSRSVEVAALSIGGMLGVNARYWLGAWIDARTTGRFPWSTFAINVSGSFAIGLLATVLGRRPYDEAARLFLLVGFLGGFTTFSTFALEAYRLGGSGVSIRAALYVVGSVLSGVVAVAVGVAAGKSLGG